MSLRFSALGVFLATAAVATAGAVPIVQPRTLSSQKGKPIELRADLAPSSGAFHVVARLRGTQKILENAAGADRQPMIWQYTPADVGTCIIATTIEPPADAAEPRTHRFEKLFLPVTEADSNGQNAPSASATARFGQRFELTPLVDPTCIPVGADLPIRVKFDGKDLPDATVSVTRLDNWPPPSTTSSPSNSLKTNASGAINVRIDHPGTWIVSVEHTATPPTAGSAQNASPGQKSNEPDRFVTVMTFRISDSAAPPKENASGNKEAAK
jgi:hypothetical protein